MDDSRRARMYSIFHPILAAGKEESFFTKWGDWFVLTDTIEDQRRPGLLKSKFQKVDTFNLLFQGEFSFQHGEYVALGCKSYYSVNLDTEDTKRSSKGIPHSINLTMNQYRDKLFNPSKPHDIEMQSLRLNKDKKMARFRILKKGLGDLFYKLAVQSDKITCTPLTVNNSYL